MAIWGSGPFDNDEAMGLVRRVIGGEGLEPALDHLKLAMASGALKADPGLGAIAVAAAEIAAAMGGEGSEDLPEPLADFLAKQAGEAEVALAGPARRALTAVLERSRWPELLADDAARGAWRERVTSLMARIGGGEPVSEEAGSPDVLASELWEPTDPGVNPWLHELIARAAIFGQRLWFEADGLHTEITAQNPEEPDLVLRLVVSQGGLVTLGFGGYFDARFSIGLDAEAEERQVRGIEGAELLAGLVEGRFAIVHHFVDDQLRAAYPVPSQRVEAELDELLRGPQPLTLMERLKLRLGRPRKALAVALSWDGRVDRQIERTIDS
jgi:hypothetical protein